MGTYKKIPCTICNRKDYGNKMICSICVASDLWKLDEKIKSLEREFNSLVARETHEELRKIYNKLINKNLAGENLT